VEKGFADAATLGPQLGATFSAAAAGMSGDEQTKKAAGEAVKGASPVMEKFIKTVEKDATSMSEFMGRVDEATLRTYAELNNIPYDKLTESIEKNIKAHEDARIAAEKQKQAAIALEGLNRNLKNVNVAVEVASDSIERMGARARAAAGGKAGFADLSKGTISRPGDLSQAEMAKGGRMEQEINAITSVLPNVGAQAGSPHAAAVAGARDQLRERTIDGTRALANMKDTLISVRTDMGTGGLGTDDDASLLIDKKLDAAGIGPAARKSIKAGLDEAYSGEQGKKALRDAINNGKLDEVVANASKGIKSELDTLKKIAKLINDTTKALEGAYKARLAIEKKLVGEYQKLHGMERKRIAAMKKIRTGKDLTPEQSARTFEKQNVALLQRGELGALAKGGKVNVDDSIKAFHALNEAIRVNEIAQREGAGSGKDEMDRRIKLMKANAAMREQLNTLTTVLKNYQNVQERGAAIEAKINKIKQDNATRLGGVDEYIGATDEARNEMDKVAALANRIADGTGSFSDVPEDLRSSVLAMMKTFSGVEGAQGERFKQGLDRVRSSVVGANLGGPMDATQAAIIKETQTPELKQLANDLEAIFKEGERIQAEAFIKGSENQIKNLNKEIKQIGDTFATELEKIMTNEKIHQNTEKVNQLRAQTAQLERINETLNKLAGLGVDTESEAAIRATKALVGKEGEEGIVRKTRRLEGQVGFQEAIAQTGDQGGMFTDTLVKDLAQGVWQQGEGGGGTGPGGVHRVFEQMVREGKTPGQGATINNQKFADRMLEMTKASLAIAQGRADVAATGKGAAEQAQMEAALAEMAKTGKGDFEATMKQLADAASYQSSKDYLNNLGTAVQQGVEQRGQEARAGMSAEMGKERGFWDDSIKQGMQKNIPDLLQEVIVDGIKQASAKVKQDAEQSRGLLDQQMALSVPDAGKRAAAEQELATDEDLRKRTRELDPNKKQSQVKKELTANQTLITNLDNSITAQTNAIKGIADPPGRKEADTATTAAMGPLQKLAIAGTKKNSIFTHDTHVEAALVSTNALLANILSAVGSGGGNGKGSSLAAAMETFNPTAVTLGDSLSAFNKAFAGGMKWTLESKHTITIKGLDGLAVFSALEGAFSSLVVDTVEALITEQLDERIPQLVKKTKQTPMGNGNK